MTNSDSVDDIKERLNDYREREKYLEIQRERLDFLNDNLLNISSPVMSDMPKAQSYVKDIAAIKADTVMELEKSINKEQEFQNQERKYIESLCQKLRKAEEKSVIQMRYIDCLSWKEILFISFGYKKDFLDKEDSYLRRLQKNHKTAIENLADL